MSSLVRESFQHRHGIGSVQQRGGSADTDEDEVEDEMNAVAVAAMMEAEAAAAAAAAAAIGLPTQSLPSSQQGDGTAAAVTRVVGVDVLREDEQAVAGPDSEGIALASTMRDNEQFGVMGAMENGVVTTEGGEGAYPFVTDGVGGVGGVDGEDDDDTVFREEERKGQEVRLASVAHIDGVDLEDAEPHVASIQMNSFIAHLAQDKTYPMIYFSYCMTDEQKDELQGQIAKYNELQQTHMMFMIQEAEAQVARLEMQHRKKKEEVMNVVGANGNGNGNENVDVARRENGAVASTTNSMHANSSEQQQQQEQAEEQNHHQQQASLPQAQQREQQQQQQQQQREADQKHHHHHQEKQKQEQQQQQQPISAPTSGQGALANSAASPGTAGTATTISNVVGGGTIGAAAVAVVAASNGVATNGSGTGGASALHMHTQMARPPVRTGRWAPTTEQLATLERNFQPNLGTPGKSKIRALLDEMSVYGPISEKNIYNWFQNRRARSKKRQVHDNLDPGADQKKLKNNIFDVRSFLSNGIKPDKKFTNHVDTKPPLIQPPLLAQPPLLPPRPPPLGGVVAPLPPPPPSVATVANTTLPAVKHEE